MRSSIGFAGLGDIRTPLRKIVISPVNLTANGRAHLGHAGGPFLRMDILARALRRSGHDVWYGLTTDGFENHVVARAAQLGENPATMAARFHVQIGTDLKPSIFISTGLMIPFIAPTSIRFLVCGKHSCADWDKATKSNCATNDCLLTMRCLPQHL